MRAAAPSEPDSARSVSILSVIRIYIAGSLDSVLFHSVDEGFTADIQISRGVCLIPPELLQGTEEQLFFDRLQAYTVRRQSKAQGIYGNLLLTQIVRQVRYLDLVVRGQDNNSFDNILEFADIARPPVRLKVLHQLLWQHNVGAADLRPGFHEEMLNQLGNIVTPLPKRR